MNNYIFEFISELLNDYFSKAAISSGERFHIRYEQYEQVKAQYEALQLKGNNLDAAISVVPFTYLDYTTYSIKFPQYQLIIAANLDGIAEDFLTNLRNRVSDTGNAHFANAAILFVHNTSLDSIVGGCKSLTETGMPLSSQEVQASISNKIGMLPTLEKFEKITLDLLLAKVGESADESYTLFDYTVFLDILGKGRIAPEDYKSLGIFPDKGISQCNSREEIRKRLAKNGELFDEISNGVQYGNLERILERHFSQEGVDRLQNTDDWHLNDFTDLEVWIQEKGQTENVLYLPNNQGITADFLTCWEKPEEETSLAKSRRRHMVVFNPDKRDLIQLTFQFDKRLNPDGIFLGDLKEGVLTVSGKLILARIALQFTGQIFFCNFGYRHPGTSAQYAFLILIVPLREALLDSFKFSYLIKRSGKNYALSLTSDSGGLIINAGNVSLLRQELTAGGTYPIQENQTLELVLNAVDTEGEEEEIPFSLAYEDMLLPVRFSLGEESPITPITGYKVWDQKRQGKESFRYVATFDKNKSKEVVVLTQGTSRYYPIEEFRENLRLEQKLILSGELFHYQTIDGELIPVAELPVKVELKEAYDNITAYFRKNNLLPSLAFLNVELEGLYRRFVTLFLQQLGQLEEGMALTRAEMHLFRIGALEEQEKEKLLKFTPLHPLNIAYRLLFKEKVGDDPIPEYLLHNLNPLNLVPLIKGAQRPGGDGNYFYQPLEQSHSAEWTYFYCEEKSSQQVSRHFVPNLVKEKIEQFVKHFPFLLLEGKAPLKINLLNQGDCREVLQGILLYYAGLLGRKDFKGLEEAPPIHVNIYFSEEHFTRFEELALYQDVSAIIAPLGFRLPVAGGEVEELFQLYSEKVRFFKLAGSSGDFEYAHLSFYQFSPKEVKKSFSAMEDVPTGISLEGLLADVPSTFQKDSYRTGFGTKYLIKDDNILLNLARLYNSFVRVTHSDDQFSRTHANAFVINNETNSALEKLYQRSQWVTFIDPKVDLSFFKNHKDVVIIHYSDQYNNASGYDAITITSKWEPYEATIKEIFQEQGIQFRDMEVMKLIDIFNAVNGHWLLKLNSVREGKQVSYFRAEKLSLLSAFKTALTFFYHPAITWVPVSLEEILRVSGAVGLSQKDGLFSVKNLGENGMHTDDLLLIGLEQTQGKPLLHLYPLEVKIGNNASNVQTKAKIQATNTADILTKFLVEDASFTAKIYRNFFAKLFLIGAEKLALYQIWPSGNNRWEAIRSLRGDLLQDNFIISNALHSAIGRYGVISFKSSDQYLARSVDYENDSCVITLPKQDALNFLTTDLDTLKNNFQQEILSPIKKDKLLINRYKPHSSVEPETPADPVEGNQTPAEHLEPGDRAAGREMLIPSFHNVSPEAILQVSNAIYHKLTAIGIEIKKDLPPDINFMEGPAFYRLEIKPAPSTTLKKIRGAAEDLNLALHLPEEQSVRLFQDVGKIWLEAPKMDSQKVKITTQHIWSSFAKDAEFKVPFGLDIEGKLCSLNFSSSNSPHLLIAGTTGSGKSVVLDTLIRGAAQFYTPSELQMFLIDPKGNELIDFEDFPHVPEPNGMSSDEAIALLERCVGEMDERYLAFRNIKATAGRAAKDLIEYNTMVSDPTQLIPRWLVVLDEYSDLLDENPGNRATIETYLRRLAQKARAAGIHVILATQKPLATIVSSAIKSNLPAVIALKVRTAGDSRVILDDNGAESLAGRGDSLFKNGTGQMIRVQCAIHEG